jgi:hypothetical protein
MHPINVTHVSEAGRFVVDVAAADDETASPSSSCSPTGG